MLIEVSLTNFRSLKEKTTLSLIADGYEAKSQSVNIHDLTNDKKLRLHNTSLVFGSNGSGKSNIIRGLWTLTYLLKQTRLEGDAIPFYDPFKFDLSTKNAPMKFELKFLGEHGTPYSYSVAFNGTRITEEKLSYWPNNRETEVFTRIIGTEGVDTIKIGATAQENNTEEKIYKNNFGISHFSSLTPNTVILKAFNALRRIRVFNSLFEGHRKSRTKKLGKLLTKDPLFKRRINALVRYSDLNINEVNAKLRGEESDMIGQDIYEFTTRHSLYDGENNTGNETEIPLKEESQGSQTIITLGTEIIHTLDEGGVLFVDEFETSLHPKLSKALIIIFQSETLNPKKAQLVFTTHDTNLMDHHIFRRDQIWFTEKNHKGETQLYSMIDFENLRESHVFEKWYLSGKFGALPELDVIEKAFG